MMLVIIISTGEELWGIYLFRLYLSILHNCLHETCFIIRNNKRSLEKEKEVTFNWASQRDFNFQHYGI